MGCEPAHLPGYAPIADARARVGAVWGATIPDDAGLDAMEMLDAAARGRLQGPVGRRAGTSLLTQPNADVTGARWPASTLLVVQDLFLNETARRVRHRVPPGRVGVREGRHVHELRAARPARPRRRRAAG